ncbi:tetratricopeptide repeat protein [Yoonia sp. BS5-3]|uniref:Tetratricopeptide repeat protein n=1 Tax=Yoonia phaeophyticola TaxID=3137369 RepID=A0ABZ2V1C4_9RHOB
MSNTDSFIDEVTEEVRREKLYGHLRRYGWIGVLAVLLLVGGAAWTEYRAVQTRNAAEAAGDALLAALNENDPAARAAAMAEIESPGAAAAITVLWQATSEQEAGDIAAAHATLTALASDAGMPEMYRDLAAFKAATLPTEDTAARIAALEALSEPGQPFRLLALEQLAYATLSGGDAEGAMTILRSIEEDAGVSRGLRERVQTLIVALGETPSEIETQ